MDLGWRPPPKLVNLQEKVDRGTLDLELSLDSYSGAPRGPRASSGPLLGLQSNVTNVMHHRGVYCSIETNSIRVNQLYTNQLYTKPTLYRPEFPCTRGFTRTRSPEWPEPAVSASASASAA
jgi:hypothetical protein